MTRPRRFDPFRPVELLASLLSATAMVPVNGSAAAAYRTLFFTVRRLVLRRRLTVRVDDADLRVTITEFDSRLDARGLAVGHLNDVTLTGENIDWRTSHFDRATVRLHRVRIQPGSPATLVAAPVDVTLDVPTRSLERLFRIAAPRLVGEIGPDGAARLRWARSPRLGHVQVDAELAGTTLWLTARRVGLGSRHWRLPARTPAYPVHLPELAHGLELTSVTFRPGVVQVSGRLPQWRCELPPKLLEEFVTQRSVTDAVLHLGRRGRVR